MKTDDFQLFAALLKKNSGLVLTQDKAYLLESRLMPVARRWETKDLADLAHRLRTRNESGLVRDVTEAMTTNESSFFRDLKPFEIFRDTVLPMMLAARAGTRKIRIWSAAASSGQEGYSIAMSLKDEQAKLAGWRIEIVGTDLSTEMIDRAKAGTYSQFEVQRGLPVTQLVKYFDQIGDKWQIKPELRQMVQFRPYNLLADLSPLGTFDVVFLRNVLIYFDQPTKAKVLEAVAKQMAPDAVLYLGGAETVLGVTTAFQPIEGKRGLYGLAPAASRVAAGAG